MYIYCQTITIPAGFALLFYCQSANFANVNINCGENAICTGAEERILPHEVLQPPILHSKRCNENCDCENANFSPVCDTELSIMYYNPCVAGKISIFYCTTDSTKKNRPGHNICMY